VLRIRAGLDRLRGEAEFDNWGTGPVGPLRAHLTVEINQLLGDDRLTVGGVATPVDPGEFGLVRVSYDHIATPGTRIGLGGYYADSAPGADLEDRDLDGRSAMIWIETGQALVRRRDFSLWSEVRFSLRDSEQKRDDALRRDDRISAVSASLFANAKVGEGRARARLRIVQGLDLFDATQEGEPFASRTDGSAIFTKLESWAQLRLPLPGRLSLELEAEGQLASRPLLSSEEMGLGGRRFLRGYDYREVAGDSGVAASAELRYDLGLGRRKKVRAQLYGFADAGLVDNLRNDEGDGNLASAGGGVRVDLRRAVSLTAEVGVPLRRGPQSGSRDPRVSITARARF
jgi:hemolysin activation/secretion protein